MTDAIIKDIARMMALRTPQKDSIRELDYLLSIIEDLANPIDKIQSALSGRKITFDTRFPSFCFNLATGVGKTRLMGACMYYLYKTHNLRHFFIIAPGETIYRKLRDELQVNNEKYMFQGLSDMPYFQLISGDDYQDRNISQGVMYDDMTIYLFNIQKIFNPRQDIQFTFHRYRETLGDSFANILRERNLVVLMDESHHYRAKASFEAVSGLNPKLGLEFTATPKYEGNVIINYTLKDGIQDKFIKNVRPIYRENDAGYDEDLENLKLLDGLKLHKRKKAYIEAYCKNNKLKPITPLVFINTQIIDHGKIVQQKIESDDFFNGEFRGKTLLIHSQSEEEEVEKLINLEKPDSKVEVVIHVNKLKEGWDVKNIYTIIPLRASISETLTSQTIGRGVRLPFGKITGDKEVDTLDVICYQIGRDNYAAIIEASKQLGITAQDIGTLPQEEVVVLIGIDEAKKEKYIIKVPDVESIVQPKVVFGVFTPTVNYKYGSGSETRLKGVDIISDTREELGKAEFVQRPNPLKHLIKTIIDEIDDLDISDISDWKKVEEIVKTYLEQASGTKDIDEWQKLIRRYGGNIRKGLVGQIGDSIKEHSEMRHEIRNVNMVFIPYFEKVVEKGNEGVVDRRKLPDSNINNGVIVGGYNKTVYTGCVFDSRQEKWFADVIDDDKEVIRWVRLKVGQMPIGTTLYGNYNPDFIVETTDCIYVIEIKGRDRMGNPEVVTKGREAEEWCRVISEAVGRNWQYKIIPDNEVRRDKNFQGIIGSAIDI